MYIPIKVALYFMMTVVTSAKVIELTAENFEHETQAATGSTTGDWLIKFYAPWCGHCKQLSPIWEQLAEELEKDPSNYVNVAKIDVHKHQHIGTRFDIRGFPTVKMLSKGKVYDYNGPRSVQEFLNFARGGFSLQDGEATPGEVSAFGEVFVIAYRAFVHGYKQAAKDISNGQYFTTDIMLVSMPLIFLVLTTVICLLPVDVPTPADKALRTKKKMDLAEPDDPDDEPVAK